MFSIKLFNNSIQRFFISKFHSAKIFFAHLRQSGEKCLFNFFLFNFAYFHFHLVKLYHTRANLKINKNLSMKIKTYEKKKLFF